MSYKVNLVNTVGLLGDYLNAQNLIRKEAPLLFFEVGM